MPCSCCTWWPYSCATTYSCANGPPLEPNLVDQLLEEVGVEVRRLVHRAVERPDRGGGRSAAGVHRTGEQPHVRAGVIRHQLMPDRVHGVAGGDHAALHVLVGVGAGLALAQVETGRRVVAGVRLLLVDHPAGIDAEEHRHDQDQQPEPPPPMAIPTAAAAGRRRGAGVDLHTLVEGHRTLPNRPANTGRTSLTLLGGGEPGVGVAAQVAQEPAQRQVQQRADQRTSPAAAGRRPSAPWSTSAGSHPG